MEIEQANFDLAVVGGGPAGTSAAITAARSGASVVLFDGSDFPRQKVCGEFVSAESLQLLRLLLGEHPSAEKLFREAAVLARLRIFDSGRMIETPIEPAGLSIPRFSLDLLLWQSAQKSGVQAQSKCEVLSIEGDGPFTLTTARGQVRARSLLVCTGRWSRFSDATSLPSGPKWIGLKAHFRDSNPATSIDLYFFRYGYCGVQPVNAEVVNVCAMVRSDCATSLDDVFQVLPQLAPRSVRWVQLSPSISTAPLLYRKPRATEGKVMLAGDAAGFIDPFAGDGISLALQTGKTAAECLQPFFSGEMSLEAACKTYAAIYEHQFTPLIATSTRVRRLLSLPEIARPAAMRLLRLPGVLPYMIKRTR